MHEHGASDLHLASNSQPIVRVRGELERLTFPALENDKLKEMLYEIAPEYKVKVTLESKDSDYLEQALRALIASLPPDAVHRVD